MKSNSYSARQEEFRKTLIPQLKAVFANFDIFFVKDQREAFERALARAWAVKDLQIVEHLSSVLVRSGFNNAVISQFEINKPSGLEKSERKYIVYWYCAALRGSGRLDKAIDCLEPSASDLVFFFEFVDTIALRNSEKAKQEFRIRIRHVKGGHDNPWIQLLYAKIWISTAKDIRWIRDVPNADPSLTFAILSLFSGEIAVQDIKREISKRLRKGLDDNPDFKLTPALTDSRFRNKVVAQLGPYHFYSIALKQLEQR